MFLGRRKADFSLPCSELGDLDRPFENDLPKLGDLERPNEDREKNGDLLRSAEDLAWLDDLERPFEEDLDTIGERDLSFEDLALLGVLELLIDDSTKPGDLDRRNLVGFIACSDDSTLGDLDRAE